jgi:Domain of unknown function (DUF1707)/Cell wall-active antibiotics response 4TMS YvqF
VDDHQPSPDPDRRPAQPPDRALLRASDAERDRVADVLREALAEGRLTPEEHAERIEQVFAARTLGELERLTADLPMAPSSARPVESGPRPPERAAPAPGPPAVAVFSEVKRHGRWRVERESATWAVFGAVRLDLREAVLEQREVTIKAISLFGSVNIDVPEEMDVDDRGFAVFGTRNLPSEPPTRPDGPVLHVTGVSLFGECVIRRKRRRPR